MWGILGVFLQAAAGQILYLALHLESGSFPRPLSPAAERAAFAALRTGGVAGRDARDQLVRHNLRLVAHVCKKYYAATSNQDDLISIGTIGLIKAGSSGAAWTIYTNCTILMEMTKLYMQPNWMLPTHYA